MINWFHDHMWQNGNFRWWEIVGWMGNLVFFSRFFVQWYATEKKKQVVVPTAFWWLSLTGSLLLLAYALFSQKNLVFIFSYAFTWIPYIRNLVIHHRHADAQLICGSCHAVCTPASNYCAACGTSLQESPAHLVK